MSETRLTTPAMPGSDLVELDTSIDVGATSAIAREKYEREAAIITAHQWPRNEAKAVARLEQALSRPAMADAATWGFRRGDSFIQGPSVHLAREIARLWGNMHKGLRIVGEDEDHVHVCGWAYDLETNTMSVIERRIRKRIQRKNKKTGETEWVKPDERDLLELVNREGAKCTRNAILELIPSDVKEHAVALAKETLAKWEAGKLAENREDTIRGVVSSFARYGVQTEDLEAHLGHRLAQVTSDEIVELRSIWKALQAGELTPAAAFPSEKTDRSADNKELAEIAKRRKGAKKKKASTKKKAEPEEAPEEEPEAPEPEEPEEAKPKGDLFGLCPECKGSGSLGEEDCPTCGGSGETML